MKKIYLLISLLSSLFFVTTHAQSTQQGKLVKAVEQLRKAMVDPDSATLDRLILPELSYGHSGGHVDTKAAFISKIVTGKSDFVSIELTEQTIAISNKTAVVRHKLDAVTNDNGKPGEVHLLILLIWQKQHGSWKLLARQAVKSPTDQVQKK